MHLNRPALDETSCAIAPDDPEFYRDPEKAFRWLQRHSPAHSWTSARGRPMYLLSRWADVRRVSANPTLFSSSAGHMIDDHSDGRQPADPRLDTPLLHNIDPPEHDRHRKLVSKSLTGRRVNDLEPRIRRVVGDVLDEIPAGQPIDAVDAFAAKIPLRVIITLLGLPLADLPALRHWSDELAASVDAPGTRPRHEVLSELFDYLDGIIAQRRADPQDDLITSLAFAEVDGAKLSHAELLMHIWTGLVAGNETARSAIAGGLEAFIENPEQYAKLLAEPKLAADAADEVLRWVTPARYGGRTVTTAVELSGRDLAAGEYVLMLYSAANRDPKVFAEPYRFDIERENSRAHVAFGHAVHYCVGAPLGRLELRVVLEELCGRFAGLSTAGPATRTLSPMLNGYERLPIVLHSHA